MPQVLNGDCVTVLKTLPENSIDTVYTTPSPFGYYENEPNKIGGEYQFMNYIRNLVKIISECKRVLKESGNLFIQLGDQFSPSGNLLGIPMIFEYEMLIHSGMPLNDRLFWHRTEKKPLKNYKDRGFFKNYEYIWHYVKNFDQFYFNTNSKYIKTSIFSYPLADSYYSNEFDSGLPEELAKIIIDTTVPPNGIILDPLAGSGKVGFIAKKMNRDYILIDISSEMCDLMKIRLDMS